MRIHNREKKAGKRKFAKVDGLEQEGLLPGFILSVRKWLWHRDPWK